MPAKRVSRSRGSTVPRLPIELLALIAKFDKLVLKKMVCMSTQLYAILHVEQYKEIDLANSTVAVCLSASLYGNPQLATRIRQLTLTADWDHLPMKPQTYSLELSALVAGQSASKRLAGIAD